MRQFILAKGKAAGAISAMKDGQIGLYAKDKIDAPETSGKSFKSGNLVLYRSPENGGPVLFPVFNNDFSFVKGEYVAATTFKATISIPKPTVAGDYSVIIVKKGVKFNERNKWTATVHLTSGKVDSTTAAQLAEKLVDTINGKDSNGTIVTPGHGVKAVLSGTDITIQAINAGEDYAVLGADELFGVKPAPANVTTGDVAYGDAMYVQDLAEKAAADAGFEYTYRDAYYYLYPNYPLNPLKSADTEDKGFTIFTIRFAEPREMATHDHLVYQIVQIALPTGDDAIAYLDTVFKGMSGVEAESKAGE